MNDYEPILQPDNPPPKDEPLKEDEWRSEFKAQKDDSHGTFRLSSEPKTQPAVAPCPVCGYCPHCGGVRRGFYYPDRPHLTPLVIYESPYAYGSNFISRGDGYTMVYC